MKSSLLVTGILFILAGLAQLYLAPIAFHDMSSSITKLDSSLTQVVPAQSNGNTFSGMQADYSLGQIVSTIGAVSEISNMAAIGFMVIGIVLAVIGVVAKSSPKIVYFARSDIPQILKARLAKGEINQNEYKSLIKCLKY